MRVPGGVRTDAKRSWRGMLLPLALAVAGLTLAVGGARAQGAPAAQAVCPNGQFAGAGITTDEAFKAACGLSSFGGGGQVGGISPGGGVNPAVMQGAAMLGNAVGTYIGSQIGAALFGPSPGSDPAAIQAQQQAAIAAQQQAAAAAQAQAAAAKQRTDAIRARLLGEMVGFDTPAPPPPPAGADSGLVVGGLPLMPTDTVPGQTVVNFGVPASVACKTAINCSPDASQTAALSDGAVPVPSENSIPQMPSNPAGAVARSATRSSKLPPPVGLAGWTPRLLRSGVEPGGHPVGKLRPSDPACRQLAAGLDKIYEEGRFAVLAADVYGRYDPNDPKHATAGLIVPLAARRISDDRAAMSTLLPGMSDPVLQRYLAPPGSDYRAAIYRDKRYPKQIYLVFRGTETEQDWAGNVAQQTGNPTEYMANAVTLAKRLKAGAAAQGLQLTIIGHSLGGAMADAAGAVTHTTTVSFNPEGVHPNSLPKRFDIASARQYVTDIVVDHEPLNYAQDHRLAIKADYAATIRDAGIAANIVSPVAAPWVEAAGSAVLRAQAAAGNPIASDIVGSFGPDALAPAIGRRVTIEPAPRDLAALTRDTEAAIAYGKADAAAALAALGTVAIGTPPAAQSPSSSAAGKSGDVRRAAAQALKDLIRLHQMTGVMDALSHQFDDDYAQYRQIGCAGP